MPYVNQLTQFSTCVRFSIFFFLSIVLCTEGEEKEIKLSLHLYSVAGNIMGDSQRKVRSIVFNRL